MSKLNFSRCNFEKKKWFQFQGLEFTFDSWFLLRDIVSIPDETYDVFFLKNRDKKSIWRAAQNLKTKTLKRIQAFSFAVYLSLSLFLSADFLKLIQYMLRACAGSEPVCTY